jgi:hypothetical protein
MDSKCLPVIVVEVIIEGTNTIKMGIKREKTEL